MDSIRLQPEHVGLPARDPVALSDWYVRMLGARVIFKSDQTLPAFFLEVGQGWLLEIYAASTQSPATADNSLAGWRHLALRVDSIESARRALEARGVRFDDPVKPAGGGGRVLFFRDAENNLLHLVERPAESIFNRR